MTNDNEDMTRGNVPTDDPKTEALVHLERAENVLSEEVEGMEEWRRQVTEVRSGYGRNLMKQSFIDPIEESESGDMILFDEAGGEVERRELDDYSNASEALSDMFGEPEKEFEATGYEHPGFDELEFERQEESERVVDPIDHLTDYMNHEDSIASLRTLMLEAWLEAWFRKSSESKESDRPDFHEQVAKRDFERWWNRNYE